MVLEEPVIPIRLSLRDNVFVFRGFGFMLVRRSKTGKTSKDEPPSGPLPANKVKPTIPSLINKGYFSLSLIISLSGSTTSFLTTFSLPFDLNSISSS